MLDILLSEDYLWGRPVKFENIVGLALYNHHRVRTPNMETTWGHLKVFYSLCQDLGLGDCTPQKTKRVCNRERKRLRAETKQWGTEKETAEDKPPKLVSTDTPTVSRPLPVVLGVNPLIEWSGYSDRPSPFRYLRPKTELATQDDQWKLRLADLLKSPNGRRLFSLSPRELRRPELQRFLSRLEAERLQLPYLEGDESKLDGSSLVLPPAIPVLSTLWGLIEYRNAQLDSVVSSP